MEQFFFPAEKQFWERQHFNQNIYETEEDM